jgi:phage antirepressor YoqD-like protein
MHQKLALKFAAWLNPEFELWVYDRIEELLRHGITATPATIEAMIANPDLIIQLATQLKAEREENQRLAKQNASMVQRSQFIDVVFKSEDRINIGQAAKLLKLPYGRNKLFETLREHGILFKNKNEPKQEYVNKGYFVLIEQTIPRENNPPKIILQTLVTQTGLAFLAKTLGVVMAPEKRQP